MFESKKNYKATFSKMKMKKLIKRKFYEMDIFKQLFIGLCLYYSIYIYLYILKTNNYVVNFFYYIIAQLIANFFNIICLMMLEINLSQSLFFFFCEKFWPTKYNLLKIFLTKTLKWSMCTITWLIFFIKMNSL